MEDDTQGSGVAAIIKLSKQNLECASSISNISRGETQNSFFEEAFFAGEENAPFEIPNQCLDCRNVKIEMNIGAWCGVKRPEDVKGWERFPVSICPGQSTPQPRPHREAEVIHWLKPCPICDGLKFYEAVNGGYFCPVCQPRPEVERKRLVKAPGRQPARYTGYGCANNKRPSKSLIIPDNQHGNRGRIRQQCAYVSTAFFPR